MDARAREEKGGVRRFWGRGSECPIALLPGFAKIDQFAEEGDALQQGAVADDEHAFTRTGQRHVEFAVDPLSALVFKLRAAEEGQLRGAADGEAVDDGVALRTLETLDGVDGHVGQFGVCRLEQGIAHQGDLSAIGDDDAQVFAGIETAVLRCEAFVLFDGEASDEVGFGGVALGGVTQLQSVGRTVVEGDARQGDPRFLVGEGDGTEFAFVELSAGEIGHLGVHASLAREVVATRLGDALDEAFEKRAPTIRHAHCAQFGFGDEAFGGRLLHDGRELAVVADQN